MFSKHIVFWSLAKLILNDLSVCEYVGIYGLLLTDAVFGGLVLEARGFSNIPMLVI